MTDETPKKAPKKTAKKAPAEAPKMPEGEAGTLVFNRPSGSPLECGHTAGNIKYCLGEKFVPADVVTVKAVDSYLRDGE